MELRLKDDLIAAVLCGGLHKDDRAHLAWECNGPHVKKEVWHTTNGWSQLRTGGSWCDATRFT